MLLLLAACQPADPVFTPPAPAAGSTLCPSTAAEGQALWTSSGSSIGFLRWDGTSTASHPLLSGVDTEGASAGLARVVGSGGWTLALATVFRAASTEGRATELTLFDANGAVPWAFLDLDAYASSAWVGADGSVVWDRGWEDFDASNPRLPGRAWSAGGDTAELDGWPFGPAVDGLVPLCDDRGCRWQDPFGATSLPSRFDGLTSPRLYAGGFVWVDGADLILDQPDGERRVALPGASEPSIVSITGPWLLATEADQTWRVDLDTGEVLAVAPTLPAGLRPFEDAKYCEALPPTVDDEGGILLALRDDARGALWRTDPAGREWRQIGAAVTDALWLTGEGRAGIYVVYATSADDTYCPQVPWRSDPGALSGSTVQLVYHDTVYARATEGTYPQIPVSPAGPCALDEGSVLDLAAGGRVEVADAGGWVGG